ncbi:hypothetical protein B0T10DRAFT_496610 [Thelonectria olida]|uniref:Uncharacterized protein n=1 Tax=Thelonectria olida TaxID=1576542 RepID=A0A9P9AGW5_9HYPO|nr:hypothetical protein B0T10DRAFT_496610 [Thelonectria olida]
MLKGKFARGAEMNWTPEELPFLYLLMHRWYMWLLKAIRDHCDPDPKRIYGPACMQQENELP